MPQLAMGGAVVAGLLYEVDAHGMAGRMRRAVLDAGEKADLVPDAVDERRRQAAAAVDDRGGRKEKGR